jgi:hypothetical protein
MPANCFMQHAMKLLCFGRPKAAMTIVFWPTKSHHAQAQEQSRSKGKSKAATPIQGSLEVG